MISIGGAVMHNLALELKRNGHEVTGSDDEIFEPSKSRLEAAGLLPSKFGWDEENIHSDLDVVILGMHARADNPELIKAQKLGLNIQSFPEYVYQCSKEKKRVVIAGSHGKTTTTAMVMHLLMKHGLEFDYLVGSKLEGFDLMVKLSDAPIIVIEGDEYLSSPIDRRPKFLWYKPHITVITGIAWDHINVSPTYENYVQQFELLMDSMEAETSLIYYELDQDLAEIAIQKTHLNGIPYRAPESKVENGSMIARVGDQEFSMQVFGDHNLANMQAAVNIGICLGLAANECWIALQDFAGTARRLEKIMERSDIVAFKDFAHSPSKVKATVEAVRKTYPDHHLVAVLELHTFSSLNKDFLPLYRHTMQPADRAIVHYHPHVFEMKRMEVLQPEWVANSFEGVQVITDMEQLVDSVVGGGRLPCVYLFMSSGNWGGINWQTVLESRPTGQ